MSKLERILIIAVVVCLGTIGFLYHSLGNARNAAQISVPASNSSAISTDSAAKQPAPTPRTIEKIVQITNHVSPAEILERLKTMRATTDSPHSARLVIHQFENLIECGDPALPVIGQFLTQNVDVDYEAASRRRFEGGKMPTEFQLPPSLRFGLFEAAKRIGGDSAEKILLDTLSTTGRGVEVAYLAYALQEMAPNKYRDAILSAAHDLLARPVVKGSANNLDKNERDFLYGVLNYFNDGSYIDVARREFIKPDGKVDAVAVRYIQQTLGEQSVAFAAQYLQDPRITADQREPLARVALNYTGIDPQADQLWRNTVTDLSVPEEHRKNLIEDLNETGFADPQHLTQNDLPVIEKRLNILDDLAKNTTDPANLAAINEAHKDLIDMRNSLLPKQ